MSDLNQIISQSQNVRINKSLANYMERRVAINQILVQ